LPVSYKKSAYLPENTPELRIPSSGRAKRLFSGGKTFIYGNFPERVRIPSNITVRRTIMISSGIILFAVVKIIISSL
jgi:hypothetical protein